MLSYLTRGQSCDGVICRQAPWGRCFPMHWRDLRSYSPCPNCWDLLHCCSYKTRGRSTSEPRASCLRFWQSCSRGSMEGWTNCLKSWVNIQTVHPWCYSWTTKSVKADFQLCCITLQWLWSRLPPPPLHHCGADTILVWGKMKDTTCRPFQKWLIFQNILIETEEIIYLLQDSE